MPTSKDSNIPVLTGIRFFAALMIFVLHYADRFEVLGQSTYPYLRQLFLGVQVFFVLSGFIIAYTYLEKASFEKPFLRTYFIRRIARILPLYLLLTTITFIVIKNNFQSDWQWLKLFFLNISLVKGFSSNYHLTGIEPTWSLTVEETFYLLAPIIFVLIRKRKFFFLQVPLLWLIGLALVGFFTIFPFDGFFSSLKFTAFVSFFGRCFEFYCGIWLAIQYKSQRSFFQTVSGRWPVLTLVGFLAIIAIIMLLVEIEKLTGLASAQTWLGIGICNLVFPLVIVILLAGLLRESSWIQRLLSTSMFQLLGRSSYAFFLIHTGVFATALNHYLPENIALHLILLVAASIILFLTVEKPVNLFIRRRLIG